MPALMQPKFVNIASRKVVQPKPVEPVAAAKKSAPSFLDYLRIALTGVAA